MGPWTKEPVDRWRQNQWGTRLSRWWERQQNSDALLGWFFDRRRGYKRFGGTRWPWPWQPRVCSFCGGVHADDGERLIREGWTVEGTNKSYKAYLQPPNGWGPVPPVKVYYAHVPPSLQRPERAS